VADAQFPYTSYTLLKNFPIAKSEFTPLWSSSRREDGSVCVVLVEARAFTFCADIPEIYCHPGYPYRGPFTTPKRIHVMFLVASSLSRRKQPDSLFARKDSRPQRVPLRPIITFPLIKAPKLPIRPSSGDRPLPLFCHLPNVPCVEAPPAWFTHFDELKRLLLLPAASRDSRSPPLLEPRSPTFPERLSHP